MKCRDCVHYGICEYSTFADKEIECKDYIYKIEKYFWECPNCHEKVDVLKQLTDLLFDEDGEADFAVGKNQGLWFHTIFCPKCEARWIMSISGMELEEE